MATTTPTTTPKSTILFLGATGGSGFSVLHRSLAAGHTCIALCRNPSKLTEKLAAECPTLPTTTLIVAQGNAHDVSAVSKSLRHPTNPAALVDTVVFTIGGAFSFSKGGNDDPNVCRLGMQTLLAALAAVRAGNPQENQRSRQGQPRILCISTMGISQQGRDFPLVLMPIYHIMLKSPHVDKKAMEEQLVASSEIWTLIRPSLLMDGPSDPKKKIRVGMEDPIGKVLVSKDGIGYTITREDVGRWIFEEFVQKPTGQHWVRKIATITH